MTTICRAAALLLSAGCASTLSGQALEKSEVRIPFSEVRQLLAQAARKPDPPPPSLLSARLRILIENGRPLVEATFRATHFAEGVALVPLTGGSVTIGGQEPAEARIVSGESGFRAALDQPGTTELKLRLLPVSEHGDFTLTLPPCPSAILETGTFPANKAFKVMIDGVPSVLASGQTKPLLPEGCSLDIRELAEQETRLELHAPTPSAWSWQQQVLVRPEDGGLSYQLSARASAADGSGVDATIILPREARDIKVTGDDLTSQSLIRGENRKLELAVRWKTRGILDRQLWIAYHMPLRPLDRKWRLEAPGGGQSLNQFLIADSPLLSYTADKLSGPLTPQGLPSPFSALLDGCSYHLIESDGDAELEVTPIAVAATAKGEIVQSEWLCRIEPDGAMLATGQYSIHHDAGLVFPFDTPAGMKLLSCEVNGRPASPVDPGEGKLQLQLSPGERDTLVKCSFTGDGEALDPVEGTLHLTLPRTPLFIHSLVWQIDLPADYQAETHGNLKRTAAAKDSPPSRIALRKNLCREARPEIHVFYQRADINH